MLHFHKEGAVSIMLASLVTVSIVFAAEYFLKEHYWVLKGVQILALLLLVIVLQFFRNPNRNIRAHAQTIVAPVDGKVVVIEEVYEGEYFKEKRIQVSIFMSPINVHVNRNPISGIVKYFKYHPGKFLVAWHPKSSTENERTTVVIENNQGVSVLFRQIAGALARRIVCYSKEGQPAEQGEEFGFIKFGSRVDVFLPLGTEIKVGLGEVVKGGITVLAHLKK